MRDKKTAKPVESSKMRVRRQLLQNKKVAIVSEFSNFQIAELSNLLTSTHHKPSTNEK